MQICLQFLDCFEHGRRLCHECIHVGLCDGQVAIDCDVIGLAEYESIFNDRLKNIDDQFKTISVAFNEILNAKKNAVIEMHRKDPRITRHDVFVSMQKIIDNFYSMNLEEVQLENNETITNTVNTDSKRSGYCRKFSDNNLNVFICSCNRFVNYMGGYNWGYIFLKHPRYNPKINNKVLKWTLQVPRFNCYIGKVIQETFHYRFF